MIHNVLEKSILVPRSRHGASAAQQWRNLGWMPWYVKSNDSINFAVAEYNSFEVHD
jgi:hypothetical protein